MATEDRIYVNDTGTVFEVETEKNLMGTVVLRLEITRPNGSTVNWIAEPKDGFPSIASHIIQPGELSQAGMYHGRIFAKWSDYQHWHGMKFSFYVYDLGR